MSLWRPFPFKPPHCPSSVGSYRFCPQNILHIYSSLPSPTPAAFLCEPTGQGKQRSKLASKTRGRGRGMTVFFFLSPLHHVHFSRLTATSIADYLLWPLLNSAPHLSTTNVLRCRCFCFLTILSSCFLYAFHTQL